MTAIQPVISKCNNKYLSRSTSSSLQETISLFAAHKQYYTNSSKKQLTTFHITARNTQTHQDSAWRAHLECTTVQVACTQCSPLDACALWVVWAPGLTRQKKVWKKSWHHCTVLWRFKRQEKLMCLRFTCPHWMWRWSGWRSNLAVGMWSFSLLRISCHHHYLTNI